MSLNCGNSYWRLSTGDPFPCSSGIKPPSVKCMKGEDNPYCEDATTF